MSFIKSGFTGGFIGIVIGIADIFVNSRALEKVAGLGLWLASSFGKVCINTEEIQCTLAEKFTTMLATIVGNCMAYFILGVLISLAISVIKMWFKSKPQIETTPAIQEAPKEQEIKIQEVRPKKKARVSKTKKV